MKFVLLNQFFPPDSAPTGRLLADLAEYLAAEGHQVEVLCSATPYRSTAHNPLPSTHYPQSTIHNPQSGIRVTRIRTLPFAHRKTARLASWLSFYTGALLRALRSDADIVLTMTTPPLLSLAGELARRFRRARHVIWEMDVYPDVAVALGVLKPRGLPDRVAGAIADFARRRAAAVLALGPCMRERLAARGIPESILHVAENWADPQAIRPRPFPQGPLTLLYSGNLGLAHEVASVAGAIASLKHDPRFRFVFAGAGPRRPDLADFCAARANGNVSFLPYQDAASIADHLAACHVGIVTQEPSTLGCVVPSKTYALMAAGRPILFIGPSASTAAQLIERFRCGWVVRPGETDDLLWLLDVLAEHPELVLRAGQKARQSFLENYTTAHGVSRVADILTAACRKLDCLPPASASSAPLR